MMGMKRFFLPKQNSPVLTENKTFKSTSNNLSDFNYNKEKLKYRSITTASIISRNERFYNKTIINNSVFFQNWHHYKTFSSGFKQGVLDKFSGDYSNNSFYYKIGVTLAGALLYLIWFLADEIEKNKDKSIDIIKDMFSDIFYLKESITELAYIKTSNDQELSNNFQNTRCIAICGIQGQGKSTLARKFAEDNFNISYISGQVVYELDATTPDLLEISYRTMAKKLVINNADITSIENLINEVNKKLNVKCRGYLLLFDNAKEYLDIKSYIPFGNKGKILVTTRAKDFFPVAKGKDLHIKAMTEDEASKFFSENYSDRKELANYLGRHPRNLVEIAAYLKANSSEITIEKIKEYIRTWENHYKDKNIEEKDLMPLALYSLLLQDLSKTMKKTNDTSIIKSSDPIRQLALDILSFCSFISPDSIRLDLIKAFIRNLHKTSINNEEETNENIMKALKILANYSLIGEKEEEYFLHPSVQLRHRRLLEIFDESILSEYHLQCLDLFQIQYDSRRGRALAVQKKLIPHIETLIKIGHELETPTVSHKHTVQTINVLNWLGYKLMQLDEYRRSKNYLERAKKRLEEVFKLQTAQNNSYSESADKILSLLKKKFPSDYEEYAKSYASNLRLLGRLATFTLNEDDLLKYENDLRLAYAIYDKLEQDYTLEKVYYYDDLGNFLLQKGKIFNERSKLEEAQNIFKDLLTKEAVKNEPFRQYKCHVRLAILLKISSDKDPEAINNELYNAQECLKIENKPSQEKLRNVDVYHELVDWYLDPANPERSIEKAESFLLESEAICEEITDFNENSADYALVQYNKARIYNEKSNGLKDALIALKKALSIQKIIYEEIPNNPHLVHAKELCDKIESNLVYRQEERHNIFTFHP